MPPDEAATTPDAGSRPGPLPRTPPPPLAPGPRAVPGAVTAAGSYRRFAAPRYLVLCLLGVAMLVSLGGWIAMVLMDKEIPDGFPVVIGTVIGGLVGIAATDRSA